MKKSTLLAGIGLALSMAMAGSAIADTPRYDARQHNQRQRIVNGVRNGELTMRETRRLAGGQVHLNRVERRAEADGVVTGARTCSPAARSEPAVAPHLSPEARRPGPQLSGELPSIEGHVSQGTCPFHFHGPGEAGIEFRAQPVRESRAQPVAPCILRAA